MRWAVPMTHRALHHLDTFPAGPFTRDEALNSGLTRGRLQSSKYERLFPRVYVRAGVELSHEDWVRAARLSMPQDAQVSHLTRLQMAGLDIGPRFPLHFTVTGDLHRDVDRLFLHRTIDMPPTDDVGVVIEAAVIGYAATARTIDLIKACDWLLHRELMNLEVLEELCRTQRWRPGADHVLSVLHEIDARAASLPESETRLFVTRAGLPRPEANVDVYRDGVFIARVDLLFRLWRLALEYEGRQHLIDVDQWNRDIVRYADLREADYAYLQITHEMLRQPKALVLRIYRALVEQGYDGPAPHFGAAWRRLFECPTASPVGR